MMNTQWRKAIFKKNTLRNIWLNNKKNPIYFEPYRKQRNYCTYLKRKSIRNYFSERCLDGPSNKNFWPTIKPFLDRKNKSPNQEIILAENDKVITDKSVICEIFNNFYANDTAEATTAASSNLDVSTHQSVEAIKNQLTPQCFNFNSVSEKCVFTKIRKLNSKKATGHDDIPAKALKISAEHITMPITYIINKGIKIAKFPSDMKKAEVLPSFKKKCRLDKRNYRPVSILPSLSKIFEQVLTEQLDSLCESVYHNMISAYRKAHSCHTILIKLIEDWREALDNKYHIGAVLMDLSRAFDELPHELLLAKLSAYGMDNTSVHLLKSYLSGRKQRVKLGNTHSSWLDITKGVPQGSIMGPILFNLFMNDIYLCITDCELYNYADDNTIVSKRKTKEDMLIHLHAKTLECMQWFQSNYMQANPDKFQAIQIDPNLRKSKSVQDTLEANDAPYLEISDSRINFQESVNLLGITIDDKLTFNQHVSDICKRAVRQLNVLCRLSHLLDMKTKLVIYKTYIMSNFNYCPLVWHFCSATNQAKMEKIQNRALKFVFSSNTRNQGSSSKTPETYECLLAKAKLSTLTTYRLRALALQVFKSINKLGPSYLHDLFHPKIHKQSLRSNISVSIPTVRSAKYGRNSLRFLGAKLWNELPNSFKTDMSLKEFKTHIEKWEGPNCKCASCSFHKS